MSNQQYAQRENEYANEAPVSDEQRSAEKDFPLAILERKMESMIMNDEEFLKPLVKLRNLDSVVGSLYREMPYEILLHICDFIELVFNDELKKRICEEQFHHDMETLHNGGSGGGDDDGSGHGSGTSERTARILRGPVLMRLLFGYFEHDPNRNCFLIFRHVHDMFCGFFEFPLRDLQSLTLDVSTIVDINRILAQYPNLKNFALTYCARSSKNSILEIEQLDHQFRNVSIPYYGSQEMDHTPKLAIIFSKVPTLKSLVLYNHKIGAEGAMHLSKLPNLTFLDVSGNDITDIGARCLLQMSSLKSLSLAHNRLTSHAFEVLVPSNPDDISSRATKEYHPMSAIENLNLTRVPLDEECLRMLAQCPTLKQLTLGGVKSECKRDDYSPSIEVQPRLLELLIGSNNIEHLNLRYNRAIALDNAMKWLVDNQALRSVNLTFCGLTSLPVQLAMHPTLEFLDLSENDLGDDAAEILSRMPRLRKLILDDNELTDRCAPLLASSTSLTYLSLNGHAQITDVGVQQLLRSDTIEELSLRAVNMTDQGLKYIGENNVIKYLYCANTDLGEGTITEASLRFVARNSSLVDFKLFGRHFIKFKQDFDSDQYDTRYRSQSDH